MGNSFLYVFAKRLIVSLVIVLSIFSVMTYQRVNTSRRIASATAQETMVHIDIILNNLLDKTDMLKVFLQSMGEDEMREIATRMDGKYQLDKFNLFASMLRDSPSIRALQLLPNGVTTYTYPLEGNESAIGDRILERPGSRPSALLAKETGKTIVVGPYKLVQGGWSLIARNPIYYKDGSFWGFAVIIMNLPDVIEPLGLNDLTQQGFEYSFEFLGKQEHHAIASTFQKQDVSHSVVVSKNIAGRDTELHIIPSNGWLNFQDFIYELMFFILLAVIIAYLSTCNKLSELKLVDALEKEKHLRMVTVQAYKEAEQANAAKSTFLSTMSHDLRTPMNAIVGLCTLLQRDSSNAPKVEDYASKLTASSRHLLGLINDILDMSKIESGKLALNVREFSLIDLIDGVNTIVRPQARAKHQVFEITINQIDHEILIADDLRLNQILLNLLSNAVKYTQMGGHIQLTVSENEARSNNIANYTFEIVDNGIGMSKEFIERIYEPFTREETSQVHHIQGTGLGMTITNNLVKLMGGTIDIESQLRVGTKVKINLDIKIKNDELEETKFLKSMGISNILLIDDDISVSNAVSQTMKEAQVSTFYAASGQEAFDYLEKLYAQGQKIDLILLDLKLKNEDGLDVARHLKAENSQWKDVPIYILTSFDYTDIEIDAMDIGVSGFLMKPLFISNLKHAIETAGLQSHKQQKSKDKQKSVLEGMRVLAAEDNELNSEILVELLGIHGATCKVCKDGKEIVEVMKNAKPNDYNFILMDVQMPIMNGLDATKAIRALDSLYARSIPIIAMTANAFTEDIKRSMEAGMNYHISKPIDFDLLENYVKNMANGNVLKTAAPASVSAAATTSDTTPAETSGSDSDSDSASGSISGPGPDSDSNFGSGSSPDSVSDSSSDTDTISDASSAPDSALAETLDTNSGSGANTNAESSLAPSANSGSAK